MSFTVLALVCLVALAGPILSLPRFRLPVVIGELVVGIVLGRTGFQVLDAANETLAFMGDIGFALVMFVAGTHVPVLDPHIRRGIGRGAVRAAAVGVLAVPAGLTISYAFGDHHGWLYAVLLASSSAGLVLPVLSATKVESLDGLEFLTQLAIADTACIIVLPLAIDPVNAGRAALGTLAVIALASVFFGFLRWAEKTGRRRLVHDISERRKLTIELRVVLVMLFALSGLAVSTHVSVMLAGFAMGLVVAAVGEPKRIANQMLALTEGFFAPIFFVWLGSSLDLRALAGHPQAVLLGLVLGVGALVVHGAMSVTGQPPALAFATAAQLGVPVGAAALGTRLGIFRDGEPTALLLGAMVTVAAVAILAPRMQAAVGGSGRTSAPSVMSPS